MWQAQLSFFIPFVLSVCLCVFPSLSFSLLLSLTNHFIPSSFPCFLFSSEWILLCLPKHSSTYIFSFPKRKKPSLTWMNLSSQQKLTSFPSLSGTKKWGRESGAKLTRPTEGGITPVGLQPVPSTMSRLRFKERATEDFYWSSAPSCDSHSEGKPLSCLCQPLTSESHTKLIFASHQRIIYTLDSLDACCVRMPSDVGQRGFCTGGKRSGCQGYHRHIANCNIHLCIGVHACISPLVCLSSQCVCLMQTNNKVTGVIQGVLEIPTWLNMLIPSTLIPPFTST